MVLMSGYNRKKKLLLRQGHYYKMWHGFSASNILRTALALCLILAFLLQNQLSLLETQHSDEFFASQGRNEAAQYHLQQQAATNQTQSEQNVRSLLEKDPFSLSAPGSSSLRSGVVVVSPLAPLDYEKYTVRVNTWKRQKQLKVVLKHLLTCESVAQIQVVWCTAQGDVPDWLRQMTDIVVEEHEDNSLNSRFDMLQEPPTAGILNQDDDILRPCIAMDAGFALWTVDPDRMVGFDARSHSIDPPKGDGLGERWSYSYLSSTTNTNQYSLSLTRFAFLHRDYLQQYTTTMPAVMRERVAQHLNCEDIAMSFWVSAQTDGKPPLLADVWAMKSAIKLEEGHAISGSSGHKQVRDDCVNDFAELLNLKRVLKSTKWIHGRWKQKMLQSGIHGTDPKNAAVKGGPLKALLKQREEWVSKGIGGMKQLIDNMKIDAVKAIK